MPLPESHRKLYVDLDNARIARKIALRNGDQAAAIKATSRINELTEKIANLGKYERYKGIK